MFKALLVTASPAGFAPFCAALTSEGFSLAQVDSGRAALEAIARDAPDLVIIDDRLRDIPSSELILRIAEVNSSVSTAVASELGTEDFHRPSPGLGVMAQLPLLPGPAEVAWLVYHLQGLADAGS